MAEEKEFGKFLIGLELIEGDRFGQGSGHPQQDGAPILSLRRSGIGESGLEDLGQADDGFFIDAVVVEDLIAHLHSAEKITGLVVSDSIPNGLLLF